MKLFTAISRDVPTVACAADRCISSRSLREMKGIHIAEQFSLRCPISDKRRNGTQFPECRAIAGR